MHKKSWKGKVDHDSFTLCLIAVQCERVPTCVTVFMVAFYVYVPSCKENKILIMREITIIIIIPEKLLLLFYFYCFMLYSLCHNIMYKYIKTAKWSFKINIFRLFV